MEPPRPPVQPAAMNRLALLGFFLVVTTAAVAAEDFWSQLTPEERAGAGLDQLTPAQQAALDRLADRYAREGARREVEVVKAAAKKETADAVREVREKVKAEAKAEAKKQKAENAGLAARDDDETIRTRIVGDFRGWSGHTTFKLENGQTWQQDGGESRFFPKMTDPDVELVPSKWAGWKMTLVKEGLWIRVKRIH